ncbi:MAG: hypothetical protein ACLRWN_24700 [Eisenbergiella sp.]|nr:hypothetical protein [Eisenbergiella sp. OF01-20]
MKSSKQIRNVLNKLVKDCAQGHVNQPADTHARLTVRWSECGNK